jgi:hypothetical protein
MLTHNINYGLKYQMSPVMENYVNSLVNPHFLKFGLAIFPSKFVFGENFQTILDKILNTSIKKIGKSPNTLHKYGADNVIENDDLSNLINSLLPFINEYFGIDPCKKLSLFVDFSVHYSNNMDTKLEEHRDDSDITINICLKNNLKSTGLVFSQIADTLFSKKSNKSFGIDLNPGDILIHRGSQSHQVLSMSKDDKDNSEVSRVNLILWFKII